MDNSVGKFFRRQQRNESLPVSRCKDFLINTAPVILLKENKTSDKIISLEDAGCQT
jgi:hypothetical protein